MRERSARARSWLLTHIQVAQQATGVRLQWSGSAMRHGGGTASQTLERSGRSGHGHAWSVALTWCPSCHGARLVRARPYRARYSRQRSTCGRPPSRRRAVVDHESGGRGADSWACAHLSRDGCTRSSAVCGSTRTQELNLAYLVLAPPLGASAPVCFTKCSLDSEGFCVRHFDFCTLLPKERAEIVLVRACHEPCGRA